MTEGTIEPGGAPDGDGRINILIVDDEPKNLNVLESILDDPEYRLVRAGSADQALLALVFERFALLILDVRMPGMTGFELAQLIKERKSTAGVPIIFLTAYYNEDQHVLEGYGSGAVDYLHKPVNPNVLRSKVAVFADIHRKNREVAAANRALRGEVAERRRAEERLRELNETLEWRVAERTEALRESDRRKDEFLATLAHELRNPLAPVRNAVEVLRLKGPDISELNWARGIIERQMQAMTRLIDDLLDVSRISRGKIELKRDRLELADVVQAAIESSRPQIERQGHELVVELPEHPVVLDGDFTRLAQVFLNLLNNASKFSSRGGRITLTGVSDGNEAVVSVRDTGIGIAADHIDMVFEMFSQVKGALARTEGGLGIGLSLVKRLVEMHGGRVEVRSDGPDTGSEFVVRLPLAPEGLHATAAPERPVNSAPASRLSILVVDDNVDAAESLAMILEGMGNRVFVAYDGEEALQKAGEHRPDVIFLDIGLPKLNGYEACRAIRGEPWGRTILVIAVTGWGQERDVQTAMDAGFDRHLVKPVDPRILMDLLGEVKP